VLRTYAPVGETPILHHTLSRDHLSVIGAVSLHEKLYFQVHEAAISSAEVIRFLDHLRHHIPGKLLIVWDGAMIHRSKAIRQYLRDGAIFATGRPNGSTSSVSPAMPRRSIPKRVSGGI